MSAIALLASQIASSVMGNLDQNTHPVVGFTEGWPLQYRKGWYVSATQDQNYCTIQQRQCTRIVHLCTIVRYGVSYCAR